MTGRIVIIDGNSLINRAYYAMQRPMMTKEGIYTQAIYGFINMLTKIQRDYEPDYIAVAWDLKAPTFRHKEYEDYKAGRRKMPMELAMQIPLMKEILEAMHISNLSLEGYEADDIIGTLAKLCEEQGLKPLIITGDKDALQLASDTTHVLITKKGISEFDLYDKDKMLERYELTPEQFIDLKGLMGDQSDNIPGIPGVGEKTGINLLKQFGTIENMLSRTDEISSPKLRAKVEDNAQLALMSRRLAEIQVNVPLDIKLGDLKYTEPDIHKLIDLYSKLEFNSFLKKMDASDALKNAYSDDENNKSESIKINPEKNLLITSKEQINDLIFDDETVFLKVFSDNSHTQIPSIIGISLLKETEYFYVNGNAAEDFINRLNESNGMNTIGHNLANSLFPLVSNELNIDKINPVFDTEIAAYLLDPSKSGYSLKAILMEIFHEDLKDEKDFYKETSQIDLFGNNDKEFFDYGFAYTSAIAKVYYALKDKINNNNLDKVFYEAEMPLIKPLVSMESEGFKVDLSVLKEYGDELKGEIDKVTSRIYEYSGEEFNINSTQQLGDILFDKLGLTSGKKTKKGYSTSAEVLEKIREEHPIVEEILRYRMLSKLNSTYVDGLEPLVGYDDRIRAHFNQTVTATGRISCTEPNLQNIPIRNEYGRLLRKAFIPRDKNHILVGADYSQIELRVLAHLSQDESLIEAFNRGDDIHRATASRVFGIPYDEVTSLDRSKAKAVNFGVIYGMSGFGLSEELGITRKEAELFIKDYFSKHPKVKAFMDEQIAMAKDKGYTETILGRRRYIPEIGSSNYMVRNLGERLAMNSPIQGSAADIIKIAMIKVWSELKRNNMKSKLILQVHDELIIDTDISEKDQVEELLKKNMMEAMDLDVKLICDLNTGDNWYELK